MVGGPDTQHPSFRPLDRPLDEAAGGAQRPAHTSCRTPYLRMKQARNTEISTFGFVFRRDADLRTRYRTNPAPAQALVLAVWKRHLPKLHLIINVITFALIYFSSTLLHSSSRRSDKPELRTKFLLVWT